MNAKADLHLHTTYSDGALSPYELVKKAKAAGLEIISITDHDSVGAFDEAIEIGKEFDVDDENMSHRLNLLYSYCK